MQIAISSDILLTAVKTTKSIMKPITLTILLSVIVIITNAENPEFLSGKSQDTDQIFQRSGDEFDDDSTDSRSDEENLGEDSIMKVCHPI